MQQNKEIIYDESTEMPYKLKKIYNQSEMHKTIS